VRRIAVLACGAETLTLSTEEPMRRLTLLFTATLLMAALFAACGGSSSDGGSSDTDSGSDDAPSSDGSDSDESDATDAEGSDTDGGETESDTQVNADAPDVDALRVAAEAQNEASSSMDWEAYQSFTAESCADEATVTDISANFASAAASISNGLGVPAENLTASVTSVTIDAEAGTGTVIKVLEDSTDPGVPLSAPNEEEWVVEGDEWRSIDCGAG